MNAGLPVKRMLGAALVLVIGLLVTVTLLRDDEGSERGALEDAVRGLKAKHPGLFGEFTLLSDDELAARDTRHGLRQHEPRGALLAGRPELRWQVPDGAPALDVSVLDEQGKTLFAATTDKASVAWPAATPPLAPGGRYRWTLIAHMRTGPRSATMGFRVLDAAAAKRYRDGLAAIRAEAAGESAALLAAHWAIRAELFIEAGQHVRDAGKRRIAHETRAWVDAKLGR